MPDQCLIPDCYEPIICPEFPICHDHATDVIIAAVRAVTLAPE
jgi:hypothetical protein